MAIIPIPAKFSFTDVGNLTLQRASNILRSRYTGQSQRILYPFAVWEFKGTLVDYDGPEAAAIRAFFVALEGTKHTFRLPVPGYTYDGAATQVVLAAHAARVTQIALSSNVSNGRVFKAGDYITIADELKVITQDASTDAAGGGGTLNFQPPMRQASAASPAVNYIKPTCLMHAADDDIASWGIKAPNRHGLKLEAVEAVSI